MEYKDFKMNLEIYRSGLGKTNYFVPKYINSKDIWIGNLLYFDYSIYNREVFPTHILSESKFLFTKKGDKYREIFTGLLFSEAGMHLDNNTLYVSHLKRLEDILPLFKNKIIDRIDLNICYDEINKSSQKNYKK